MAAPLGATITSLLLERIEVATAVVRTDRRRRIEAVIDHFESSGFDVYNAHRREQWRACMLTPDEYTRLDYEEIRDADLFVAFPGEPASGTHIAIGWASGLGKPVIFLVGYLEATASSFAGFPPSPTCGSSRPVTSIACSSSRGRRPCGSAGNGDRVYQLNESAS